MTNTTSPIAKLFGWIRRSDDAMLMRVSTKFTLDREELAQCIVWDSGLMSLHHEDGECAQRAEQLPLTAKAARTAVDNFVWQMGHPSANCRDIEGDEQDAVDVISRRLKQMGIN